MSESNGYHTHFDDDADDDDDDDFDDEDGLDILKIAPYMNGTVDVPAAEFPLGTYNQRLLGHQGGEQTYEEGPTSRAVVFHGGYGLEIDLYNDPPNYDEERIGSYGHPDAESAPTRWPGTVFLERRPDGWQIVIARDAGGDADLIINMPDGSEDTIVVEKNCQDSPVEFREAR